MAPFAKGKSVVDLELFFDTDFLLTILSQVLTSLLVSNDRASPVFVISSRSLTLVRTLSLVFDAFPVLSLIFLEGDLERDLE